MAAASQHRISSRDGLRGISVALVFLAHGGASIDLRAFYLRRSYRILPAAVRPMKAGGRPIAYGAPTIPER
jgi:peptidoglycan/LPS O-acetylase OafA/YrhL